MLQIGMMHSSMHQQVLTTVVEQHDNPTANIRFYLIEFQHS